MLRILTIAAFLCTGPAAAQPLVAGTWTGALSPTRGGTIPVEAELEECLEGWKVDLKVAGRAAGEAQAVRWADNRLRFRFVEPRSRQPYTCTLTRRADGSLAGSCAIRRGRAVAMSLSPPAAGAFGCSG